MIAFWGTQHKTSNVKGFIGLEGIYNLPNLIKKFPNYQDWFITKAFGDNKNLEKASPASLPFQHQGRWLVVHSENDELVDLQQSKDFEMHLKKESISVNFLQLKKENHFQVVEALNSKESVLNKAILKFINN